MLTPESLEPIQLFVEPVDPYFAQLVALDGASYAYGAEKVPLELDDYDAYLDGFGFPSLETKGTLAAIFRAPIRHGAVAVGGGSVGIDLDHMGAFACERHRELCLSSDTLPVENPPEVPELCPLDTVAFANVDPGTASLQLTSPPGTICYGPSSAEVLAGTTTLVYLSCVPE